MESLETKLNSPRPPSRGSNWGCKIPNFDIFPYISFIIGFRVLEYVKRYWETICAESNWGHKIAYFVFLHYISFILAFRALECIKSY